jgi:hypothetical protein
MVWLEDADAEDCGRDVAAVEALELSDEDEEEAEEDVEEDDEYGERAACCLRRESVERSRL